MNLEKIKHYYSEYSQEGLNWIIYSLLTIEFENSSKYENIIMECKNIRNINNIDYYIVLGYFNNMIRNIFNIKSDIIENDNIIYNNQVVNNKLSIMYFNNFKNISDIEGNNL